MEQKFRFVMVVMGIAPTRIVLVGPYATESLAEFALREHSFLPTDAPYVYQRASDNSMASFETQVSGLPANIRIISPAEWDAEDSQNIIRPA